MFTSLMVQTVRRVMKEQSERLLEAFVVVQPGQVRIRHRPGVINQEEL